MKNLVEPGCLGTVKIGRKVIVDGLNSRNETIKVSMTVVNNGVQTVLRGSDGKLVKADGHSKAFCIDLPFTRKNLGQPVF